MGRFGKHYGGIHIPALESMAEWLGIDAALLGFVLGILIMVIVIVCVSIITDSTMAVILVAFVVWIFIALPGIEIWPTWTLTIGFLLLILMVVYPNMMGGTERRGGTA